MKTLNQIFSDTIEIKGSKFIAHLMPMSMYDEEMRYLRKFHPKAVHWVSAYRYLNEFDQIVEHSGDDGEPKGTSGKPTLSVLQGHELINVAIITVRYFGGTKLGPGGLVRAYAEAANAAVVAAAFMPYEKKFSHCFACDYKNVSIVEYELTRKGVVECTKVFSEKGAVFRLKVTSEQWQNLVEVLERIMLIY